MVCEVSNVVHLEARLDSLGIIECGQLIGVDSFISGIIFKTLVGPSVADTAYPVDADFARVSSGLPDDRNFLEIQGTKVEVGRSFRATVAINFLRGQSPILLGPILLLCAVMARGRQH